MGNEPLPLQLEAELLEELGRQALTFTVVGTPAPQGSKRAFVNKKTGRAQVVESSKGVRPWREAVKWAALDAIGDRPTPLFPGAVGVLLTFRLPRPQSHYGTGRNAGVVKPGSPAHVSVRPDLDKLVRSTLDGLKEAQLFSDDSKVAQLTAVKLYAGGNRAPGCEVTAWEAKV